jgi:hypothetical protein
LSAPPAKTEAWRERLGSNGAVKIGLVSSGGLINKNDKNRSIPLKDIAYFLPEGPEYFLIQKDLRSDDGLFLKNRSDMRFVGDAIETFLDTAAICMSMDLIISVDTSVAHLSGALHRPTWILLPFDPDWRWQLNTDQTPWYPSAKLYRQLARKDWAGALQRVSEDLKKFLD